MKKENYDPSPKHSFAQSQDRFLVVDLCFDHFFDLQTCPAVKYTIVRVEFDSDVECYLAKFEPVSKTEVGNK